MHIWGEKIITDYIKAFKLVLEVHSPHEKLGMGLGMSLVHILERMPRCVPFS